MSIVMSSDYFDFLNQNSQQENFAQEKSKNEGLVNLTVRADADCQVLCDGEFLVLLNANQIVKEKAPVGQHLIQFVSIKYPDIIVEECVDWPEAGKNYLILTNKLKKLVADQEEKDRIVEDKIAAKKKAVIEAKERARAEEKEKEKAEAREARIKAAAKRIYTKQHKCLSNSTWKTGCYVGQLHNRLPEGVGKITFKNGESYEGEFLSGHIHGKGSYHFPDGAVYMGEFDKGKRKGIGTMTWPDGSTYSGRWIHNKRSGKGVYIDANGNKFDGRWANDGFIKGTITRKNGKKEQI